MSKLSRRGLFGLFAGAAVAPMLPAAPAVAAPRRMICALASGGAGDPLIGAIVEMFNEPNELLAAIPMKRAEDGSYSAVIPPIDARYLQVRYNVPPPPDAETNIWVTL